VFFAAEGLPVLLEIGLLIFCLIDVIQTPEHEVRNLAKGLWILLIIIIPLIGGIAWLVAGRPVRSGDAGRRSVPWAASQTSGFPEHERARREPRGPDDDPEYLNQIRQVNEEQESTLKRWEDDLRRREEQLRRERGEGAEGGDGNDPRS
jgi:hypothetical protein